MRCRVGREVVVAQGQRPLDPLFRGQRRVVPAYGVSGVVGDGPHAVSIASRALRPATAYAGGGSAKSLLKITVSIIHTLFCSRKIQTNFPRSRRCGPFSGASVSR